jgi:hypothetical protein
MEGLVGHAVCASFFYALVAAMVSGDVNDNRLLFMLGGVVVAMSVPVLQPGRQR